MNKRKRDTDEPRRGIDSKRMDAAWRAAPATFSLKLKMSHSRLIVLLQIMLMLFLANRAGQAGNLSSRAERHQLTPLTDSMNTLSGTLASDTTMNASMGPWRITNQLVVPANVTLTIGAGCLVYFDPGAGIRVQENGQLVADGAADQRILLAPIPGSNARWNGLVFENTLQENRLSYVDMESGDAGARSIYVKESRLLLEYLTWTNSDKTILEVDHPYVLARHCIFPNTTGVETVHGQSLDGDEYFILQGNTLGTTTGYNDVVDFSDCKRPGPVFQVYDNMFLGGSDDGLDLDGCDSYIEGNVFANFHKGHTGASTSNAIATGEYSGKTTDLMVARNIFYDSDHAILLKEGCFMHAENNTFVKNSQAAINFSEWPDRDVAPGEGAALVGDIFWDNGQPFGNQISQPGNPNPEITVDQCLIESNYHSLGQGNIDGDPMFFEADSNFHLLPSSPALQAGPNGLDMGAYVPAGISISGEPNKISHDSTATLTIGGPGITDYMYSVNSPQGPWSEEISIAENSKIVLSGLQNGASYTVYVKGKNWAGAWQQNPDYAVSRTWTVDLSASGVANQRASHPENLELLQNYPNPFNSATSISFRLMSDEHVRLKVTDLVGREVVTLADRPFNAGTHTLKWDAGSIPSGIYYYTLSAGTFTATKRMLLIR
jgi:hypothetical protein